MNVETGRGLLELTRPINAVAAGILTAIGAFVAAGLDAAPVPVAAATIATVLATGAGNAINDYFDREIDRINEPDRPIPRGAVSPGGALAFTVVLFTAAVLLVVLLLPPIAVAIATFNLFALVAYTKLFKGLPGGGNVLVGVLGGSTFLFGAAAIEQIGVDVGVLFVLAALSTITREIVKDVEDIAGDSEAGLRTLPIVIGERRSLHVGTVIIAVAVVASPLPYLRGPFGLLYLVVLAPAIGLLLVAVRRSYTDPTTGQRYLKYGMFLAAVAFVAGRISTLL